MSNKLLTILAVGFMLPIIVTGALLQKTQPDAVQTPAQTPEQMRAEARVAIGHLCAAQHGVDDFLSSRQALPGSLPAYYADALEQFASFALEAKENTPALKAVFQRVADGDTSPEAIAEMQRAAVTARDYATRSGSLSEQLLSATQRIQSEIREQEERVRREQKERDKRERGWGLGMTQAGYRFIKEGMSPIDLDLILGCSGVEQSSSGSLKMYHWQDGFKMVTATFQNSRLISKTQFGLP